MIAAFVVNYRCASLTARAVASVLDDCPTSEVIVVDNSMCAGETQQLRTVLPSRARLITAPANLGFGAANELALAASSHDPVLLLNPDAIVIPGCVAQLTSTLRETPTIGAVAPMIWCDRQGGFALPPGQMESPAWELWRALADRWRLLGMASSFAFRARALRVWTAREPVRVPMLSGAVMMVSRAAIRQAGGLFDPRFFMYYEDTDLSRRLRSAGLALVIDPRAHAIHAWQAGRHKNLLMADGRRAYMEKHFRGSKTLRWVERMRLRPSQQLAHTIDDLGPLQQPPCLTAPPAWQKEWLLEVSPISAMVPAMGLLGCGAKVDPGKPWWDNVAAGRYYARLGHARRVCPPARYYSWEVSPVLAHSGDAQDPLAVLAVAHETPSGSTVSFAEVSPRPSAMLLARLGFEPKPTHEHEYVKRRQSAWRLARAKREDSRPLRELFRAAFGHDMPAELWEWKYGAERGGFGVAVWRGAQAVAYYGAMPRWLRFFAQPVEVIQICDVMTHPAERGVLTRSGPFVCAALTFAECCVGTAAPYPFAFGFPSARHERLGTKLGIYHAASRIVEVSWPCRRSPRSPWWSTRVLGWNARDALAAEQLWHEMAQSLAQFVVADRPASYLRSRFLEHPVLTYTLLLVRHRWTMQPRGIAVLRDHGAWMELVDLVSAVDHMAMTVDAARRYVGNSGRTELRGWITEEFVSAVRSDDASVAVTEITVPLLGTPAMPAAALAGRSRGLWFLMAGDTDFH